MEAKVLYLLMSQDLRKMLSVSMRGQSEERKSMERNKESEGKERI